MNSFLKVHKNLLIVQLSIIILITALYQVSTKKYYNSSIIYPIFTDLVIKSTNGANLTQVYDPNFVRDFYLKELSNEEVRKEIFEEFIEINPSICSEELILEPSIQVYSKSDDSFPVSETFTNIQVKSACKELTEDYLIFLTSEIHERSVEKIQTVENEYLMYQLANLEMNKKNDLSELEIFFKTREETLRKLIPSLKNSTNISLNSQESILKIQKINPNFWNSHESDTPNIVPINLDIQIPLTKSAAEAELNFISSLDDLNKSIFSLITRNNLIKQYQIKHDFSHIKIVNISHPGKGTTSNRNLYLALFSIFVTLCFGYVLIAIKQYKNRQTIR